MERFIPGVRWLRHYRCSFIPRRSRRWAGGRLHADPAGARFRADRTGPGRGGAVVGHRRDDRLRTVRPVPATHRRPGGGYRDDGSGRAHERAGIESSEQRLGAAALVAIMVGAVLLVAGLFRLGAIADFLSRPILVGYINGVAASAHRVAAPGRARHPEHGERLHPAGRWRSARTSDTCTGRPYGCPPSRWCSSSSLRRVLPELPWRGRRGDGGDRALRRCSGSRRAGSGCSGTSNAACRRSGSP